jgi:hypothetical protein
VSASNNLTILIFISQDSDPICHKLWQSFWTPSQQASQPAQKKKKTKKKQNKKKKHVCPAHGSWFFLTLLSAEEGMGAKYFNVAFYLVF